MKTIEIKIPVGYEIDKEKSTFEKIVFKKIKNEWIDLGLPSGNLWKNINENGYFTHDDAVEKFKDNLPTIVDFAELVHYCQWKWSSELKGMIITGPNKNYIVFPAIGYQNNGNKTLNSNNAHGYYWSASFYPTSANYAYYLYFSHYNYVNPVEDCKRGYGYSIRCVKHK